MEKKERVTVLMTSLEKKELQNLADKYGRGSMTAFIFKAIEYFKQNNKVD